MIAPETSTEESQHPDVSKSEAQQVEGEQKGQGPPAQRGGEEHLEEVDVEGRDETA